MRENCTYGSWRSLSPTVYIIRKGEKFTHAPFAIHFDGLTNTIESD